MAIKTPDDIRQLWFGSKQDDLAVNQGQAPLWWSKNAEQDGQFADTLPAARSGELDAWAQSPGDCLALILVLDQFPRVIHRDTPDSFACDPIARRHCLAGLAAAHDQSLRPIERIFFYLPLEHSKDLAHQGESTSRYQALANSATPAHRQLFGNTLIFAEKHRDIIARLGRFPHRNAILGRESTPAEPAFLQEPGSSF